MQCIVHLIDMYYGPKFAIHFALIIHVKNNNSLALTYKVAGTINLLRLKHLKKYVPRC